MPPLVTFAVFAYNQEGVVREAIEAAFAQTYQPLEIILSDDCSTDGTFAIMQEMARNYVGPHQVRVRRSACNAGVLNHVIGVAHEARGIYLVAAAGDDVSYPERTTCLVGLMQETNAAIAFSAFDSINDSGALLERNIRHWAGGRYDPAVGRLRGLAFHHGASAAYRCEFVREVPQARAPVHTEDVIFSAYARYSGFGFAYFDQSLMAYRVSPNSLSNYGTGDQLDRGDIRRVELREASFARHALNSLCYRIEAFASAGIVPDSELARLNSHRRFFAIWAHWIDRGLLGRLQMLAGCRTTSEFRFMMPRLLGLDVYVTLIYGYRHIRDALRRIGVKR